MKLILKLAWRNIWRNWRRTVITALAIIFATFMSIFMIGIQTGTYEKSIKNALDMFPGYIQIQYKDYQNNPSLRKSFKFEDNLKNILESTEGIENFAPRIIGDGLVGFNNKSLGSAIIALNPEKESKVSKIKSKLKSGKFLSNERPYDIVMGYKMIENLGANIGDTIVILSAGYDGSMGNLKFRISGSSRLGSPRYDAMSIFMNLQAANELFAMYGNITMITLKVNDINEIEAIKNEISSKIQNEDLLVMDWKEFMPELKQSVEFDRVSGYFYRGILIMIVAFGILNTVIMSITERFREFGVMLALGIKRSVLVKSTFFEILFLSLIGIVIGTLLGFIVNFYFAENPIQFSGNISKFIEQYGFVPEMRSSINPMVFIQSILSIFIVSIVVFIYPAIKLNKLEALKGIRYT